MSKTIVIVGGGAAGFFAAIAAKESSTQNRVIILEKHQKLLSKVRISGGGRCNVTHACFDPRELVLNYPRGSKELLGPFHRFNPTHTIDWFKRRGVELKIEADGRMFPTSNSSETIIKCLMDQVRHLGVEVHLGQKIKSISKSSEQFTIQLESKVIQADQVILATGSSPQGLKFAQSLKHTLVPQVPSLFTFNVPRSPLKDLSGIASEKAKVKILGTKLFQQGPLLITHFGFSGPAVLKLSAWAARELHEKKYSFDIAISWVGELTEEQVESKLKDLCQKEPKKTLKNQNLFQLPKKLWKKQLSRAGNIEEKPLAQLSKKEIKAISRLLACDTYSVSGKTTNKEEFVTCGGVKLSEVNFKTMESKLCQGLHFAGEILDIDGITGGFNFQNAWTTGYISGVNSSV